MSNDYQSEDLLNGNRPTQETKTTKPPDWGRVKWRQLEKGERVEKGDWVDMCRDGWRDDPKWVPAIKIGESAPDPCCPSHRTFRRIVPLPNLWEEIASGKVWARATKKVDGKNMGLKCEMELVGGKFRWMTLNPQKFGAADTLQEAIEQVETFLHNTLLDHP